MRSDTQLWTRHEMDMGEGMPEEVFHMPATPEEIKEAHGKCGTCYKCADDEGRRVCINGDSPMCTEDVDPKLDYCRFHHHEPKEE